MKKILFLDSVHPLVESKLVEHGFVVEHDYASPKSEIEQKLNEFEGLIIRSRFKIDASFLNHGKHLKFIGRYGAGLENIDVPVAESFGINCIRVPEGNADAVGEQALGMLLMLFNNLKRADTEVRKGVWLREENRGYELTGKTVGIIGYGYMGKGFAKKISGFNCEVLVYDKYINVDSKDYVKQVSLEELFEKSDVLSIHVPLTEETRYMVNSDFINRFKKNIYIINTARGPILKIADLVEALKSNKVMGACLDVLEYEKTSFENLFDNEAEMPITFKTLIESDKVILSPHIAGWSFESYVKLGEAMVSKILSITAD